MYPEVSETSVCPTYQPVIRRSSEPRKNTGLMIENSSAPIPPNLCAPRSWTLDNVEYLGIIQLIDFYK